MSTSTSTSCWRASISVSIAWTSPSCRSWNCCIALCHRSLFGDDFFDIDSIDGNDADDEDKKDEGIVAIDNFRWLLGLGLGLVLGPVATASSDDDDKSSKRPATSLLLLLIPPDASSRSSLGLGMTDADMDKDNGRRSEEE